MMTLEDYLERLAGNAEYQRKYRHNNLFQRRNVKITQFGINYTGISQNAHFPAEIYIPITDNLITYSQWSMQFIISPIIKTNDGVVPTTATQFQFYINGVDMTPYFKLQYNGWWCNGNGMFPNKGTNKYDLLVACQYMSESDRDKVLNPGMKRCTMYTNGSCQVTIVNWLDINATNK